MQKAIIKLFYLLIFVTPFIFLPITSELFEFNKIIFVYLITTLISSIWIAEIIILKKVIFKNTILDIPLILFLISQLLATIFSIDIHTSIFGYYSRFNGSLLSTICYSLLYWAFVTHVTKIDLKKVLVLLLIGSGILSVYAILEHFGISISCFFIRGDLNTDCFVQDVKNRVFATLGQPNWLAAYLVSLMSLAWHQAENLKNKKLPYVLLSILLFTALLYTKSRSGMLAFGVVFVFYWVYKFFSQSSKKVLLVLSAIFVFIYFLNSFTSSINQSASENTPALESGGTESGIIRQIVWNGALNLFIRHPILGTGVETFAYSYYETRPAEHNLTSEWDYVYNKAHNEFLNILANTGIIGIAAYGILITIIFFSTLISTSRLKLPLLLGFLSLQITNFFGFSVVNTSILFVLFPAFALVSNSKYRKIDTKNISHKQKVLLLTLIAITLFFLYTICSYWIADILYKQGRDEFSIDKLTKATLLNPYQAVFYSDLAYTSSVLAFDFNQMNDSDNSKKAILNAYQASTTSILLSPRNVNLYKMQSNLFIDLAELDSSYFTKALTTALDIIQLAPTDPAGFHTTGLIYANLDNYEQSIKYLEKAISLKPDYKNARIALAIIHTEFKDYEKAKSQLRFILDNIAPNDEFARKQLDNLEKEP